MQGFLSVLVIDMDGPETNSYFITLDQAEEAWIVCDLEYAE